MSGWAIRPLLLTLTLGVLAVPAPAHAQVPALGVFTGADITRAGNVDLNVFAPDGSVAVYYERIGGQRKRLGTRVVHGTDLALLQHAASWSCDRRVRRFEVDAVGPDGTRYAGAYSVRTPSCRYRFALSLPRRVGRGHRVTVAIRDTWRTGSVRPRLCVAAPGSPARCRSVRLKAGQFKGSYRFRPRRTGKWKLRLRYGSARTLRLLAVGKRGSARQNAPAPLVLATGDSTMQGVDGYLAETLDKRARVLSRLRPATGISKPGGPSWLTTSRIQSSTLKPVGTVVTLGVNDGFAMRTPAGRRVPCCGDAWTAEYSRRVRIMMRTWTRFGGHVAWMTLPPTGDADLAPRVAAVNAAILRAASGLPRVGVVRIDELLSRTGGYEPYRVVRGRRVKMYQRDMVHLSPAGTAIAARAVAAQLRRSGGLTRLR